MFDQYFEKFDLAPEVAAALKKCKCIAYAETKAELEEMAYGPTHTSRYDVVYPIEGKGTVKEAEVVRCKNGCVVNFMEDYMRRRDPNSMAIGDDLPSDKPRFKDRFGYEFSSLRQETLDWLSTQQVIMLPFSAGPRGHGYPSLMICPLNAAFFALSLANMQGFTSIVDVPEHYKPRAIIFVAPPFRHTHFDGKQVVVHNRSKEMHEVWAYNLYPGPSAKKGVFSLLLDIGEQEGWVCCHTSAAMVETPYECEVVFMHEGASGGGKSEMLEDFHREEDDRLLIGTHTVTGEKYYMTLGESCKIHPIADDMACALKSFQDPESGKLRILDAEDGWFLRMDGMNAYGNSPLYERICIHPSEPLVFFNMDGVPGATCLIWEHVIESNGKPCSNPRVILPRKMVDNIVPDTEPVEVDVRSFGVRMPPSTAKDPNYGVMGMLQVVPQSIAWLWRLISPRGFKNPSIADTNAGSGLKAEGVGSYWPFATGLKVTQANLLLEQIMSAPKTTNVLIPNQHIGAYHVGFMGEWLSREYLARHNGFVREKHLVPARCPLFGYALDEMKLDGQFIRQTFLRPETQSKLGNAGYDAGAKILTDFFKEQLQQFVSDVANVVIKDAPVDVEALKACKMGEGTVQDALQEKVLTIGENLQIRRFERFDNSTVNVAYNHMGGVIGVLVGLEVSEGLKDNATVKELGKDIGMQAAAMNPSFLDKSDVDEATLAKEKEILLIQALEENKTAAKPKPEQIIHKMVDGRIGKYYEENCLLQQAFVKENKVSVEAHIKAVAKELGGEIKLVKCVRFEKGEGIEKKVDDFAAEVASMAK